MEHFATRVEASVTLRNDKECHIHLFINDESIKYRSSSEKFEYIELGECKCRRH